MNPADLLFAQSHEWIKIENNTATVGISDHAQDALGDITFVELPAVGKKVEAGKECAVIESVKAASDIYSPINGEISEVNNELTTTPEIINTDPYGKGWIFKLKNIGPQPATLMAHAAYESFLENNK